MPPALHELGLIVANSAFLTALVFLFLGFGINWIIFSFLKRRVRVPIWVSYLFLACLIGLRTIGYGHLPSTNVEGLGIDLLFASFGIPFIFFSLNQSFLKRRKPPKSKIQRPWVDLIAVAVLVTLCISCVWNIDRHNIQGDEYFQFETAAGYAHDGTFLRFDFAQQAPQQTKSGEQFPYPRAWISTWVMAQSMNLFGASEFSARLPSAILYVGFIIGLYLVLRVWKRDQALAFLITAIFVFAETIITQGRLIRMYSYFLVAAGGAMVAWYYVLRCSIQKTPLWRWLGLLGVAIGLSLLAYHFHLVFILFFAGFGAFIFLEFIRSFFINGWKSRDTRVLFAWVATGGLMLLFGISASILLSFDLVRVIGKYFETIKAPNPRYELFAFKDFPLFGLAMITYLAGIVLSFKKGLAERFCAIIPIPIFIIFTFLLDHGGAIRFFLTALILIYLTVGLTAFDMVRRLAPVRPRAYYPFVFLCFILLFVPLHFPGVPAVSIFQKSLADKPNGDVYYVYSYIKERIKPDESLLINQFRSYYWGADAETPILILRRDYGKEMKDAEKFRLLLETQEKGWIVLIYPERVNKPVMDLILDETTEVIIEEQGEKQDFAVFYFDFSEKKN